MLKIRLQRIGKKQDPAFRIVVAENSDPIKGKFIEKIGSFMAGRRDATLNVNIERATFWIDRGAGLSDTVARMLVKQGLKKAEKFIKARVMKPKKEEIKEEIKEEVKEDKKVEAAPSEPVISAAEPVQEDQKTE